MSQQKAKKRFSFFGSPSRSPGLTPTSMFQEETEEKPFPQDDARKAVENLKRLVAAANAYKDLVYKMGKSAKQLSKALKDYGNCKGMETTHVMCLQSTSQFYEYYAEAQGKLNKVLQKDFEILMKFWDKYSRKVTKDEEANEEYVHDLDKQVKKTTKEYEKKSKKENKASVESHEKYISTLTTLGSEIARARTEYAIQVTRREKRTYSVISQIVCRLTEAQFVSFNDSLRKCGPSVTKMNEWAPFAGENMPQPHELDEFLDDTLSQSSSQSPSQPDENSLKSQKPMARLSLSEISEKQIQAMKFSEYTPLYSEEPVSLPTRYVSMPEPSLPIITIPEPTKQSEHNDADFSNSQSTDTNDSVKSASPITPLSTTSLPMNPKINPRNSSLMAYQATTDPASPAQPPDLPNSKSASENLISRFSIGIHADDHPFLRDEKVEKFREASVYVENNKSEFYQIQDGIREDDKNDENLVTNFENIEANTIDNGEQNNEKSDQDLQLHRIRKPLEGDKKYLTSTSSQKSGESVNSTNENNDLQKNNEVSGEKAENEPVRRHSVDIGNGTFGVHATGVQIEQHLDDDYEILEKLANNEPVFPTPPLKKYTTGSPLHSPSRSPQLSGGHQHNKIPGDGYFVPEHRDYDAISRREDTFADSRGNGVRINDREVDVRPIYGSAPSLSIIGTSNNPLGNEERRFLDDNDYIVHRYHHNQQPLYDDIYSHNQPQPEEQSMYHGKRPGYNQYQRRRYTDGPIPTKRQGTVADLRERFQTLNSENRATSPGLHDFPRTGQGRVNDIMSRFNEQRNESLPSRSIIRGGRGGTVPSGSEYRYGEVRGGMGYNVHNDYDRYEQYDHSELIHPPNHHCNCHHCLNINNSTSKQV